MTVRVEKVGGTSMLDFDAVRRNVVERTPERYGRILVVSAYAGVTDALLEHKKSGQPGVYALFAQAEDRSAWPRAFAALRTLLQQHNERVFAGSPSTVRDAAEAFLAARLADAEACLYRLEALCAHGHFSRADHLATVRELLASVGEAHSAWNTAARLQEVGLNARFLDLTGWAGAEARPLDEALRTALEGVDLSRELPIATGYAHCQEGLLQRYDRGYSEITFSRLAVLSQAAEAIIHKEYHLSSADPKLVGVEAAVPLGRSNFDVADQLAQLGMEAIHPKAAAGLRKAGIALCVRNIFEPEHPGTVLSEGYRSRSPCVEMVAGRERLWALGLHDPDGLTLDAALVEQTLATLLAEHRLRPLARDGNANSVTLYLGESESRLRGLRRALKSQFPQAELSLEPMACVAAVGSDMALAGLLAEASGALAQAGISVRAVQQGPRQVDMRFFVAPEAYEAAVRALHAALIEVHDHGRAIRLAS